MLVVQRLEHHGQRLRVLAQLLGHPWSRWLLKLKAAQVLSSDPDRFEHGYLQTLRVGHYNLCRPPTKDDGSAAVPLVRAEEVVAQPGPERPEDGPATPHHPWLIARPELDPRHRAPPSPRPRLPAPG